MKLKRIAACLILAVALMVGCLNGSAAAAHTTILRTDFDPETNTVMVSDAPAESVLILVLIKEDGWYLRRMYGNIRVPLPGSCRSKK